jgi:hypothetical protein
MNFDSIVFAIVVGVVSAVGVVMSGIVTAIAYYKGADNALQGTEREVTLNHAIKIAEFRQQWINDLRESMSSLQSIGIPADDKSLVELRRLRTKIELLMNRKDRRYVELHSLMYDLSNAIANEDTGWFNEPFISLCQDILKTEWEVLKLDLRQAASPRGDANQILR